MSRVAFVTGGAGGIGRAICAAFVREGFSVAVADLDEAQAREVASAAGGKAMPVKLDVTDLVSARAAIEKTVKELGQVDVLVNNAGWDYFGLFVDTPPEVWRKIIDIDLLGPINCTRAALEVMVPRKSGTVVNIASDAGRAGSSGEAVYSAAKGGLISFTKAIAREVSRHGIRVNCVCPGPTDTPLLKIFDDEKGKKILEAIVQATPMRRLAKPSEIAEAVVFFATDHAAFVTGQVLSVSGGLTMQG
jgi:2-hydroxycyclohexanecarboxyl-CoA dehydrogenase